MKEDMGRNTAKMKDNIVRCSIEDLRKRRCSCGGITSHRKHWRCSCWGLLQEEETLRARMKRMGCERKMDLWRRVSDQLAVVESHG